MKRSIQALCTLLVLLPVSVAADMTPHNAHTLPVLDAKPMPEPEPVPPLPVLRSTVDRDLLAQAVYHTLRYDSAKVTYKELAPVVIRLITAADNAGVDPFIATTVVFQESRFRTYASGDGGRACGMGQQHARFSMLWGLSDTMTRHTDNKARVKHECALLKNHTYATTVLVHHLVGIDKRTNGKLERYAWWYNGYPDRWMPKHQRWKAIIKRTYDRLVARDDAKAASARRMAQEPAKAPSEPFTAPSKVLGLIPVRKVSADAI